MCMIDYKGDYYYFIQHEEWHVMISIDKHYLAYLVVIICHIYIYFQVYVLHITHALKPWE